MATKLKNKGWVGIELDVNEEHRRDDRGARGIRQPGAVEAGMREGDVLLALNGIRFDSRRQGDNCTPPRSR